MRLMPSATESTVPTSVSSAPSVSRPSIRLLRIEVISSGLICIFRLLPSQARGLRLRYLLSKLFQPVLDRGIEDHVSDPQDHSAEDVRIDVGGDFCLLAGLLSDAVTKLLDGVGIKRHRARDPHRQQLAGVVPGS